MDDLNMPAKDTFGSQPPLELIRQWIDYGFWYDRQKQTVKNVKVRKLTFTCIARIFCVGKKISPFCTPCSHGQNFYPVNFFPVLMVTQSLWRPLLEFCNARAG